MADEARAESIATRLEYWFAIYGLYLFLAGWTYLNYYFSVYGISAGWLEFGLNETLARGFTVLFRTGGYWMTVVYIAVLLISLFLELILTVTGRLVSTLATLVLIVMFVPTYSIARHAALIQANTDRSAKTKLPTITFSEKGCTYRGDLLYVKGDLLYVHNLVSVPDVPLVGRGQVDSTNTSFRPQTKNKTEAALKCPIDIGEVAGNIPQLWLLRSSGLEDVRIVQYGPEAKP